MYLGFRLHVAFNKDDVEARVPRRKCYQNMRDIIDDSDRRICLVRAWAISWYTRGSLVQ